MEDDATDQFDFVEHSWFHEDASSSSTPSIVESASDGITDMLWGEWNESSSSDAASTSGSTVDWFQQDAGSTDLGEHDLATEAAGSVPLPIAPADTAPARVAKRQRQRRRQQQQQQQQQQQLLKVPSAVGGQHPQQPPTASPLGSMGNVTRAMEAQISSAKAWALLSTPSIECGGPRPAFLYETHRDFGGLLFKEPDRLRRMKGSDTWSASGGRKGSSAERLESGVIVRRKYGKLTVYDPAQHGTKQGIVSFNYHELSVDMPVPETEVEGPALESRLAAAPSVASNVTARIFHILPGKDDLDQPESKSQQTQRSPIATNRGHSMEGLLALQLDSPTESVRGGRRPRPRWIRFDDHNGKEKGSIEMGESGSGPVLRSGSGDFAEWHPIRAGEPRCFEEGDIVGFCPPQDNGEGVAYRGYCITLNTDDAKQFGVISRRAVVQGSCPQPASDGFVSRQEWDTVAYCGRVPAKLLGSAKSGDVLVPSGRHDGTAVAVLDDVRQQIRIGKVEHDCTAVQISDTDRAVSSSDKADVYELLPLSNSGEATKSAECVPWQLVGCSVVAPSCTVLPQVQQRQCRFSPLGSPAVDIWSGLCVLICMALLLIATASVSFASLGRHKVDPRDTHLSDGKDNCCEKMSLSHGLLQGECDGTPGSTCVYAECDNGYVLRVVASQEALLIDHDGVSNGLDAPPSRQAARPVGGPVSLRVPAGDQGTQSAEGGYRQFMPCTSCFDSDGLMCQPKNRSGYPIPLPVPTWGASDLRDYRVPHDPYDCPSDIAALLACEGHQGDTNNDEQPAEGDGELCFGPFNGFRPCERCRTTGNTPPPSTSPPPQQQQEGQQRGRAISYEADGLACEATSRGLPWTYRRDSNIIRAGDNTLCTSEATDSVQAIQFSECMQRGYDSSGQPVPRDMQHAAAYIDDELRVTELCVPLDLQKHWTNHLRRTASNISTAVSAGQPAHGKRNEQRHQQYQPRQQRRQQNIGEFDLLPNMSASRSRYCVPGTHRYNGTRMECVKRYEYCPSEQLGALRNGACRLCAGKEAVLSVPRTPTPTGSLAATPVHVPCPVGFRGSVRRTCAVNGWVDEPLVGECTRKRCVPVSVSFDDTGKPITGDAVQHPAHRVALPFAVEGSGLTSVPCPPGYTGNVSAVCAPDAEVWSNFRGRCSGPSGAVATKSAQ